MAEFRDERPVQPMCLPSISENPAESGHGFGRPVAPPPPFAARHRPEPFRSVGGGDPRFPPPFSPPFPLFPALPNAHRAPLNFIHGPPPDLTRPAFHEPQPFGGFPPSKTRLY